MGFASSDTLPAAYPAHHVRLPVGTPSPSPTDFDQALAIAGGVVAVPQASATSLIHQVAWRLTRHQLELTPLVLGDNHFGIAHQRLVIELGNPVAPGTLAVTYLADDSAIVVDMVDSEYLFITLKLPMESFVVDSSPFGYSLDKFGQWGHVSVPYSFELTSAPFKLKSLDSNNILVSLKDGQLLHFKRHQLLGDFDVFTMEAAPEAGSSSLNPFKWWRPRKSATTVDGVSSAAVVDMVATPSGQVVSVSVSKTLQFWHLERHCEAHPSIELSSDVNWLAPTAAHLLRAVNHHVAVAYTSAADRVEFAVVDASSGQLVPNLKFCPVTQTSMWFVQDFIVTTEREAFVFDILWKNNTASRLQRVTLTPEAVDIGIIDDDIASVPQVWDEATAKHHILNSGEFSAHVVDTALKVVCKHHGVDPPSSSSLRRRARDVVASLGSVKSPWLTLDGLCDEYAKMTREAFAVGDDGHQQFAVHADSGLGVFRPTHRWESTTNLGGLAPVLADVVAEVSPATVHRVVHHFLRLKQVTATDIAPLFALLPPTIDTGAVVSAVENVPDVVSILNRVVEVPTVPILDQDSRDSKSISPIIKQATLLGFKSIARAHSKVVGELVVVFLMMDPTTEVVEYLNACLRWLHVHASLTATIDTCLTRDPPGAKIERRQLNKLSFSVVWSAIVNHHPKLGWMVRHRRFNEAFDYTVGTVMSSSAWVVDVVIELINCGEAKYVRDRLFDKLAPTSPVGRVLLALVYLLTGDPDRFAQVLDDPVPLSDDDADKLRHQLVVSAALKPAVDLMVTGAASHDTSKYYQALSQLARDSDPPVTEAKAYTAVALDFQKKAIATSSEPQNDLYATQFDLALRLDDYDSVYEALESLPSSDSRYRQLFTRFVKHLVTHRAIAVLFAPKRNQVYRDQFLLIDNILLTLANDELALSACLTIYQYLYSWRLFGASTPDNFAHGTIDDQLADKRGAVESLYMFITRFKLERSSLPGTPDVDNFKLKIVELYLIILNCLKGFSDDDDKWLRRKSGPGYDIVTVNDVSHEYFRWLEEVGMSFE